MSGDYIMAVKSIGLSKVGGRKPCTLESAAKHNKRELSLELEARGRIDGDRLSLNYSIAGAADAAGVVGLASRLNLNPWSGGLPPGSLHGFAP